MVTFFVYHTAIIRACFIADVTFYMHIKTTKQNLPNVIENICTNWLFVFCSLMGVENRSANATFAIFQRYCIGEQEIKDSLTLTMIYTLTWLLKLHIRIVLRIL